MICYPRRMNRSLAFALLIGAAALSGCRAELMETRGDKLQLFKTGQEKPGKGGVVRYLSNGLPMAKRLRRQDAEKQMRSVCGGDYVIADEGPRSKFGASMPIGKGGLEVDQYWYVAFDCAK